MSERVGFFIPFGVMTVGYVSALVGHDSQASDAGGRHPLLASYRKFSGEGDLAASSLAARAGGLSTGTRCIEYRVVCHHSFANNDEHERCGASMCDAVSRPSRHRRSVKLFEGCRSLSVTSVVSLEMLRRRRGRGRVDDLPPPGPGRRMNQQTVRRPYGSTTTAPFCGGKSCQRTAFRFCAYEPTGCHMSSRGSRISNLVVVIDDRCWCFA